jgi:SAM-dependent methyltransferase
MLNSWNDRYLENEYVYGKEPNAYFKKIIDTLPAGNILIPGAGEGRDAVYAAKLGWKVRAFDLSWSGRDKAISLAKEQNVEIEYELMDVVDFDFNTNNYDLIALIYFHLPENIRKHFHENLYRSVKPGGRILLEAFSPKQLMNKSGGPKDIDMLFTSDILAEDFRALNVIENDEVETFLNEGIYHKGKANVIRFSGYR